MMRRTLTLAAVLTRDLFLSLAGIAPLAAAVAFGLIAFEYGMDQAQFMTVAGVGTAVICLLTALLLTSRASHAWLYPLLTRLRWRSELLLTIVVSSLAITTVLALLIAAFNLAAGRLTLDFPSALWAVPTWLVLWLLVAALALPLSSLTSRGGSYLAGWLVLVVLLVANDQRFWLTRLNQEAVARVLTLIFWPVSTLLGQASAGSHDRTYFLAVALVVVYAGLAFSLAAQLFAGKDLLWPE